MKSNVIMFRRAVYRERFQNYHLLELLSTMNKVENKSFTYKHLGEFVINWSNIYKIKILIYKIRLFLEYYNSWTEKERKSILIIKKKYKRLYSEYLDLYIKAEFELNDVLEITQEFKNLFENIKEVIDKFPDNNKKGK